MSFVEIAKKSYRKVRRIVSSIIYSWKKNPQHMLKFEKGGDLYPNKRFLIISDSNKHVGILTGWSHYMTLVHYAVENNLIPVIDFKNSYIPVFMDENMSGKYNYWDLYFTQPYPEYKLEDIYKSKKYLRYDYTKYQSIFPDLYQKYYLFTHSDNDYINKISKEDYNLCKKFYSLCHFSKEIVDKGEEFIKKNNFQEKKVLGVSFRRSFERHHILKSEITPEGTHPVKATLSQLLLDVENTLKENNFDYIFFTTDDRESLEKMKEKFGKKCLYTSRRVQHLFEDGKIIVKNTTEETLKAIYIEFEGIDNPVKTRNIEYLTDVYILSKCNSLLARGGSADVFAYIINDDKYEHIYE